MSKYAIKRNLTNATRIDASDLAKKTELAHLKPDVDKLNIDKLRKVANNLSSLKDKLSSLVKKLRVDKLVPVLLDLIELSDVVKNWCCQIRYI